MITPPHLHHAMGHDLLNQINERRRPWFLALQRWTDRSKPLRNLARPQSLVVAAAFSIVAMANGKKVNYASDHSNLSAMLNIYLHNGDFSRYAELLTHLIQNTSISGSLKPSVWQHMCRHRGKEQANGQSSEWKLLRQLLPEALDPILREELIYLDALPDWAHPG